MMVSPNQDQVMTALGNFLSGCVPSGVPVLVSQINKVPETSAPNFLLMTFLRRIRLATNKDDYVDCAFYGTVSEDLLFITQVSFGTVLVGAVVFGLHLIGYPTIVSQMSGTPGGIGIYELSSDQGTISQQKMASGAEYLKQPTQVDVQIDAHGDLGGDYIQIASTLFRDERGTTDFKRSGFDVVPLYMDDPRQLPFSNEGIQVENRWIAVASMQANMVVSVPQEFADTLVVGLIDVDSKYPA
jgi:hypothetical protein